MVSLIVLEGMKKISNPKYYTFGNLSPYTRPPQWLIVDTTYFPKNTVTIISKFSIHVSGNTTI